MVEYIDSIYNPLDGLKWIVMQFQTSVGRSSVGEVFIKSTLEQFWHIWYKKVFRNTGFNKYHILRKCWYKKWNVFREKVGNHEV